MLLSKLTESYYTQKDFDKYVEMNKNSMLSRANDQADIEFTVADEAEPNAMYWAAVKNRDIDTIATAFVSGIIDMVNKQKEYMSARNKDAADIQAEEFVKNSYYFKTLNSNCERYATLLIKTLPDNFKKLTKQQTWRCISIIEILNKIDSKVRSFKSLLNELNSAFKQRRIKLYRGLSLPTEYFINMYAETGDIRTMYSPAKLLKYFDNTQKLYNSFSTNIDIARRYASNTAKNVHDYSINGYTPSVILSGIATRDMINFALTSYLTGLYLTCDSNEELNISNKTILQDFKIEECNDEFRYMLEFVKQMHKRGGYDEYEVDYLFNYCTKVPLMVDCRTEELVELGNTHIRDNAKQIIEPTKFLPREYTAELGASDYVYAVQFKDNTYNLLSFIKGDFYFKHNSKKLPFFDKEHHLFKTVEGESAKVRDIDS